MCMQNYNINTIYTNQDSSSIVGVASIREFVNTIKVLRDNDNKIIIEELTFITLINGISCSTDPELTKEYEILWTLSPDAEKNTQKILAQQVFNPNLIKTEKNGGAISRYTANKMYSFSAKNLELDMTPGDKCAIKVFMRERTETEDQIWQVQTIDLLNIEEVE